MSSAAHSIEKLKKLRGPSVAPVSLQAGRTVSAQINQIPSPLQAGKASVDQLKAIDDVANLSPSLASMLRPQAAYRWLLPYLAAITPQYVEGVLRGALAGNHVQAWELFDLMIDTDPEIAACVQEYTQGITKKKFVFEPYHEEDEEPTPSAVEKAKVVSAALRNMRPDMANDENDLRGTVRDIVAARFHGQSILEIEWHDKDNVDVLNIKDVPGLGQVLCPRSTFWVHPVCYAWDMNGRLGLRSSVGDTAQMTKQANATKLGKVKDLTLVEPPAWNFISSQPRPSMLVEFPRDKFLIGIHKAKTGTALGGSCLRPLAWWWVASNFCGDWLLNYAQLFGIPFRKASYKSGTPLTTQVEIKQMLQAMGSAGYVLLPDTASLEFEQAGSSAGESPQAFLFHFADDQKRKVILHQTMSGGSHSGGSKGTGKAFGSVESDTKQDCINEGAAFAESVINQQLIPSILTLNYGEDGDVEAPTVRLVDEDEAGLEEAQTVVALAQLIDIGEDHIRRRFKLPKPAEGEAVLGVSTGILAAQAQAAQDAAAQSAQMDLQKHQITTDASVEIAKNQPQQVNNGEGEQDMEARRAIEASNAGHPFYGNQWTEEAGKAIVPVSKKANLGSEVLWKDDDGNVHHGQMGFRDTKTTNHLDGTVTSKDTGKTWVREVNVETKPHPTLPNTVIRTLTPKIPSDKGEDILSQKKSILVPTERLAQRKGAGFRPKDFQAQREIEASTAKALAETTNPLTDKLAAISKIKDPAARVEAMRKFLKDEPALTAALKKDSTLAKSVGADAMKALLDGIKSKD